MYWSVHFDDVSPYLRHEKVIVVDSKIFAFGEIINEDAIEGRKKITAHIFDTDYLRWRRVNDKEYNNAPPLLCGHSVVTYGRKVLLYGGRDELYNNSNILYLYHTESSSWSSIPTSGSAPRGIHSHSACIIGSYMYIFGGHSNWMPLSDELHRLNLKTLKWEFVTTKGIQPNDLVYHTASVIGNRMYIFGGRRVGLPRYLDDNYSNKIAYLDTSSMTWVMPVCSGKPPSRRAYHSAAVYNDEIYIFGGVDGETKYHLNDLIKYEPATGIWREVHAEGRAPGPKRKHSTCVLKDQLFLFGGLSPHNVETPTRWYPCDEYRYSPYAGKLSGVVRHVCTAPDKGIYILDFFAANRQVNKLVKKKASKKKVQTRLRNKFGRFIKDPLKPHVPKTPYNKCKEVQKLTGSPMLFPLSKMSVPT